MARKVGKVQKAQIRTHRAHIFDGKRYIWHSNHTTKRLADREAEWCRNNRGMNARVVENMYAYSVYVRKA